MSAPRPSAIEQRRQAPPRPPAALPDLDEHRRASSILVAAIGTVGTMIVTSLAASDERSARQTPIAAARDRRAHRLPRRRAGRRERRRALHRGARSCRRSRTPRWSRTWRPATTRQPRDINGLVRHRHRPSKDKSGIAAEAAAAGFPDLAPEQRPTVWLPDSHTWLVAGPGERRRGSRCPPTATSVAIIRHRAGHARAARRGHRLGRGAAAVEDVFDAAGDADLWSDLGHPEWGAFKLGKTSPVVATSGEAAMFASFGTAAGDPRRASPRPSVADAGRAGHRARARTRHEPLHGDARALPLARPPGRARPARPPTSSRRSSSTRSRSGTTTAASRAATA